MTRPYIVLVPDGMADEPQEALGGLTPLEAAQTPAMDALARTGIVGTVRTVPEGMTAGSDVANLAVLGYDPAAVYTGRSPLEAAAMGVELGPHDVAYRCNFVTVADGVMADHTAGHLSTEDARRCIAALREEFADGPFEFFAGVSYRNLLVWRGGEVVPCTPPNDILDQPIDRFLPGEAAGVAASPGARALADVRRRADQVLAGVRPATGVWFWGEGRAPHLPSFHRRYGLRGAVVGAVDLIRGMGLLAGFDVLDTPGATGDLATDYAAKGRTALAALDAYDFVLIHVEAPDEAAHMGDLFGKKEAIERVDAQVLAPLLASPRKPLFLVLPDHETPVKGRVHGASPVPFVIGAADGVSDRPEGCRGVESFGEAAARRTEVAMLSGAELLRFFLEVGDWTPCCGCDGDRSVESDSDSERGT